MTSQSDLLRQTIEGYTREVIGWADRAGVPLMSPPRVPEAAQAMHDEIVRLREILNRNGLRWTWDEDHRRVIEEREHA